MQKRRPLVAANWKMNPPPSDWKDPGSPYVRHEEMDIVVFPPFLWIKECLNAELITGGQCGHPEQSGAHTGSVSMAMLAKAGCTHVLCGHSERRREQHETDQEVIVQAKAALAANLLPIVCVGETAEQRAHGEQKDAVKRQLAGLPKGVIIAYEPIWAIGTGKNATPAQAQEMHAFIRSLLPADGQAETVIIYGGSVTAENAGDLFAKPDIDGALVGGASLKPDAFAAIIVAAEKRV